MKKHYVIEIFLMIIVMGLSGLLIIDYYNLPKRSTVTEEVTKEKDKTEYLLSIGYELFYQMENYLDSLRIENNQFTEITENGLTKRCYEFQNLDKSPNFITENGLKILNEHVFTKQESGKINISTNRPTYCETENPNYMDWINKSTIASKENILRKELNIFSYDADSKILIFDAYLYNKTNADNMKKITFSLSQEENVWKIDEFSME